MKNKLQIKRLFYGVFLYLIMAMDQVHGDEDPFVNVFDKQMNEKGQGPVPQRGYPKEVAFGVTPHRLISLHVGTLESPPTALLDLPMITEVDSDWSNAKDGDVIYDVTSWFPLKQMRTRLHSGEERWVYYNRTSGYIIANADQFLKSSIHNFVSNCIEWSGYRPRLQVIYLDVSDEVELSFKAIQHSEHQVLLRGSAVLKFEYNKPEDPDSTQFGSVAGVKCDISVQAGYYRNSYDLGLKLNQNEHTLYENTLFVAPNQWHIHECGISVAGRRRVLAVKVDHVNYHGESVHFPLQEMREMDFDAGLVSGASRDPYSYGKFYRSYKVPVDMFDMMHYEKVDPFKMKDVTKVLTRGGFGMDGFFFRYRRLLIARGSAREHKKLSKFVAELSTRYNHSKQCVLSFYEIDSTKERKSKSWGIDDLLSVTPRKLGSIGSMLSYTIPAVIQSGDSECTIRVLPPKEDDFTGGISSNTDLHLNMKLDLPSLKLSKDIKLLVEEGGYKVIQVGENIETKKLIMMVVKVRKAEKSDR